MFLSLWWSFNGFYCTPLRLFDDKLQFLFIPKHVLFRNARRNLFTIWLMSNGSSCPSQCYLKPQLFSLHLWPCSNSSFLCVNIPISRPREGLTCVSNMVHLILVWTLCADRNVLFDFSARAVIDLHRISPTLWPCQWWSWNLHAADCIHKAMALPYSLQRRSSGRRENTWVVDVPGSLLQRPLPDRPFLPVYIILLGGNMSLRRKPDNGAQKAISPLFPYHPPTTPDPII